MLKSLLSNQNRRLFANLIIFHLAYLWFRSFSSSMLSPHFLQEGFSIAQIIFGNVAVYAGAVAVALLIRRYPSRISWAWSIITSFIYILLVIDLRSSWQLYLASFIGGLEIALFYIPYNVAHYRLTPTHRTSYSSAILFSLFPIVSLIAPLAAGILANIDYLYIWLLSGLFFVISVTLVKWQPKFEIKPKLLADWEYIKATRWLVLLQSLWETMPFVVVGVFGLYFIQTPLYYGTYLAYLSLASILANLFFGHLSDKKQKRLIFLYPIVIIMGITALLFPLALNSLTLWLVVTGIISFLMPLFWNFSTSLFVDAHPEHERTFTIRELTLNIGRTVGTFLLFLNFYLQEKPTYIFYFLAAVMFTYAAYIFYQTKITRRYRYN